MEKYTLDNKRSEELSKLLDELEKKFEVLSRKELQLKDQIRKLGEEQDSSEYSELLRCHNETISQLDALLLEKRNILEEKNEFDRLSKNTAFDSIENKSSSDEVTDTATDSGSIIRSTPQKVDLKKHKSTSHNEYSVGDNHNVAFSDPIKDQYNDFVIRHEQKEKDMLVSAAAATKAATKRSARNVVSFTERKLRSGAETATKRLAEKLNPFDRKINMNDVSDTGMESVRLGYRSIKKTGDVVQGAKNTAKAVKGTAETTYKTVKTTVKVTASVVKFIGTVWEHAIAAALNPIIWIIAVIVLFIMFECTMVLLITQGYTEKTYDAYVSAKGLGKVDDEYAHGQELYKAAEQSKKMQFGEMISGSGEMEVFYGAHGIPYYIYRNSDLVSVTKTYAEPSGAYMTTSSGVCWATPEAKNALLGYWNMSVEEYQALAIAYTYMQKQENEKNETVMDIYDVLFTEELMNTIMEYSVKFTTQVFTNCNCPGRDCAYSDDRGHYCPANHTLHVIAITFYSKDDVMDHLGFSDKEKEWESITEVYFKNKYYHATPVPTPEPEAGG